MLDPRDPCINDLVSGNGGPCLAGSAPARPVRRPARRAPAAPAPVAVDPAVPVPTAPPVDPMTLVLSFLEEIELPKPKPRIEPGYMLAGKLAYLETGAATKPQRFATDTVLGPLEVVATGELYVSWGDGTTSGPFAEAGGPWPDGRITHHWSVAGPYDVTVTQRWTAEWSVGGASGTVGDLETTATLENFAVRGLEAVRER